MPIVNGSTKTISGSLGNLPNVTEAIVGWFQSMSVSTIVKTVVDFQLVETLTTSTIQAVRQPFTSKQLMIKPEGQRAWNWETLHTLQEFNVDDIIVFNSTRYRIMQKWHWKEYGYFEFHICENFTP